MQGLYLKKIKENIQNKNFLVILQKKLFYNSDIFKQLKMPINQNQICAIMIKKELKKILNLFDYKLKKNNNRFIKLPLPHEIQLIQIYKKNNYHKISFKH